ncbi:MAG TPA: metalloregulator ArsR/SmtB family transcription factor [Aggregatilineaceae bacterium]|nr:metalloregulator ArsR/SmtB family transcription factor [Aggregatilineaceae bacterium]
MPVIPIEEINLLHNNLCQAISEPKRIQILYALAEQPLNVTTLAALLETPQPTISRHLAILRQRALVTTERDGAAVIYRLTDPRILTILDTMRQMLRDALERQSITLNPE